jgi:hypothetical protein
VTHRPTALDELFVHQLPELLPNVATHHPHWRESYFFALHDPETIGDIVFLTMAHYPQRELMDSLQMGRVGGERLIGFQARPYNGDPHTTDVGAARIEVIEPWREVHLWADPKQCSVGMDLTFRARTEPYALRRGTMRAGNELIWDQCHILQSGTYEGTYTVNGSTHTVAKWWGQRDHSWGIRDHARCPLWMWLQIQFEDGFLGVWHWELANGARIYTDGCWASTNGDDPIPLVGFDHELEWVGADGEPAMYGEHGDAVTGLRGRCTFVLQDGQIVEVIADGSFDRPYEPFHRGGLSQTRVRATDGREGTAVYEVTGARHHRYFPGTVVDGVLPS